jgi:hypothetical protein
VHNPTPPTELIIRPSSGWQLVNWRELVQYRDMLYFLTIRGIKAGYYAQSGLGIGWVTIMPLSFHTHVYRQHAQRFDK